MDVSSFALALSMATCLCKPLALRFVMAPQTPPPPPVLLQAEEVMPTCECHIAEHRRLVEAILASVTPSTATFAGRRPPPRGARKYPERRKGRHRRAQILQVHGPSRLPRGGGRRPGGGLSLLRVCHAARGLPLLQHGARRRSPPHRPRGHRRGRSSPPHARRYARALCRLPAAALGRVPPPRDERTATVWHPDVEGWAVWDARLEHDGAFLGYLFVDLLERPHKYRGNQSVNLRPVRAGRTARNRIRRMRQELMRCRAIFDPTAPACTRRARSCAAAIARRPRAAC